MRLVRFRSRSTGRVLAGTLDDQQVIADGRAYPLRDVTLLAPCCPTKLVCVGRNYAAHARELGNEVRLEILTTDAAVKEETDLAPSLVGKVIGAAWITAG